MIVEQAIFGEVKGGHALRASSGDPAAAAELAPRLDLPDTAPLGVDWSPFVLGFAHRDHFVFARTFRDSSATRAGMVLSHALIAPLEDIVLASDLRPLFDRLIAQADAPSELPTLEVELGDDMPPIAADLPAVAAALSTRAAGPVVHVGSRGFDDLVVSLWARLWPVVRRGFAFRLSFSPADIVETPPPTLVCTPHSLIGRWQGHRVANESDPQANSLAAAMLGGREEGQALRDFAEMIGADLGNFSDLPLLEQAYRLAAVDSDTIGSTLAAVRLVERLSPETSRGASGKASLLSRLVQHMGTVAAEDVVLLRNLVLRGFEQSGDLWSQLSKRVAENTFPAAQDASFLLVVADATDTSQSTGDWRKAVLDGISGAARAGNHSFSAAFWRWAEADPAIIGPLWKTINVDESLEERLVKTAPRHLNPEAAQVLLELARGRHLYRLHGVTAAAAYSLRDALRVQVTVEPFPAAEGVRLVLRNATPGEIVDCAVAATDQRILQLAVECVAEAPGLLADLDLSGDTARQMWSASLSCNLDTWRGPADPRAAFDAILTDLIDGRAVPPDLVNRLARTPLADLTGYARRTELWPKLTGPIREALIRATARGWIDQAHATPSRAPEPILQSAILSDPALSQLLDQLANGEIGGAVQIVASLPEFDEHRFTAWLRTAAQRTRSITRVDSEAIGRLIQERGWRSVASELMHMLKKGREDARPALRMCLSQIGTLDRWRYGLSAVSSSEKWDLVEDLAAQLYPIGPDQDDLWERVGGHNADLALTVNGRTRWRQALQQIRRGGKGPSVSRILREMQRDYPANGSLRLLAGDSEFKDNP